MQNEQTTFINTLDFSGPEANLLINGLLENGFLTGHILESRPYYPKNWTLDIRKTPNIPWQNHYLSWIIHTD